MELNLYNNKWYETDESLYNRTFNEILEKFDGTWFPAIQGAFNKNDEYQFLYDAFLKHLISDTKKYVEKNYNSNVKMDKKSYKIQMFKIKFTQHSDWLDKISNPEKYPDVIRKIRIKKLEKINGGVGS